MTKKTAIPIPIFIILLVVLVLLDIDVTFQSPIPLFILNTLFLSGVAAVVTYLAVREYLQVGSRNLLLLGCGALAYGLAAFAAGWFVTAPDGQNINLTVFNTGALFGAVCHLAAAGLDDKSLQISRLMGYRRTKAALALLGVLLFIAGLTVTARQEITPLFFVPGTGPTLLRQVVLGSAALLYAVSAVLILRLHARTGSGLLYWYALGLGLTAVGLLSVLLIQTFDNLLNWTGRAAQYLGGLYFLKAVLTMDRSDRANLENAIANFFREAETNYRILMEMATDAVIAFDRTGRILVWNPAAERIFGYFRAEAIGAFFTELIIPEPEVERWQQELRNFGSEGELSGRVVERDLKRKNGRLFPAELSISSGKSASGWAGSAIIRDISERKQAEADLRESEARFRTLADNIAQLAWMADETGWIFWYNRRWFDYTGTSLEQVEGWGWTSVHHPDHVDRVVERIRRSWETGEPWEDLFPLRGKNGKYRWFLSRALPIRDENSQIVRWFGTNTDITERQQAEAQLKSLLHEKEVLLKEVHHRVKNNLQAVFNLLYLQADYSQDEHVRHVFRETQARIKSIALIHEKLYQTQDLSRLDLAEYLKSLAGYLLHSYGVNPEMVSVTTESAVESLDLDTAVPLGIIINELVSNALKYAFPAGQRGDIRIKLWPGEPPQLCLTVSDNGIGFPEDINPAHTKTLGLQLVHMLTSHLQGQIELERDGGTTFKVLLTPSSAGY